LRSSDFSRDSTSCAGGVPVAGAVKVGSALANGQIGSREENLLDSVPVVAEHRLSLGWIILRKLFNISRAKKRGDRAPG